MNTTHRAVLRRAMELWANPANRTTGAMEDERTGAMCAVEVLRRSYSEVSGHNIGESWPEMEQVLRPVVRAMGYGNLRQLMQNNDIRARGQDHIYYTMQRGYEKLTEQAVKEMAAAVAAMPPKQLPRVIMPDEPTPAGVRVKT